MGAHALGAAAYAAQAAGSAHPKDPGALLDEVRWQLGHLSMPAQRALRQLPKVGDDPAGPLGTGLLASGVLGTIITRIQAELGDTFDHNHSSGSA